MTRFGWVVTLIMLLVVAGIIGGWYALSMRTPIAVPTVATSTPPIDLSARSIYTNGEYGFSIIYPANDPIAETFTPWRLGGTATGTPILSIIDTEGTVRIGASTASKEVTACIKAGPAEEVMPDMQLASTTFKVFTRDLVGTDDPMRVVSYRAVHEGACVALEVTRPVGASASLRLAEIVQSFSFARP